MVLCYIEEGKEHKYVLCMRAAPLGLPNVFFNH